MANKKRKPQNVQWRVVQGRTPADVQVRGRDMLAPVGRIRLGDKQYDIKFNNSSARVAEDVYADVYGQDVGYGRVLAELANGKWRAIMAVLYGALVAGGGNLSWEEFDAAFKLDSIEGIDEVIMRHVAQSLPQASDAVEAGANP